jgi:hypothetical protein
MKNYLLILAAAGMLAACNQNSQSTAATGAANSSHTAADTVNAPVMKFKDITHDFGKIKTGEKVHYEFSFINTGKSPLIVKDAVASCGCTKPEWPKEPIQPGATGLIKVTFDSAGKSGLQDKQITITANTNPAQNMVHLIGEVTAS